MVAFIRKPGRRLGGPKQTMLVVPTSRDARQEAKQRVAGSVRQGPRAVPFFDFLSRPVLKGVETDDGARGGDEGGWMLQCAREGWENATAVMVSIQPAQPGIRSHREDRMMGQEKGTRRTTSGTRKKRTELNSEHDGADSPNGETPNR